MAKKSMIAKDKQRRVLAEKFAEKRAALKEKIYDREAAPEERFQAALKLAELPRNSAKNRQRNRCEMTGRPRAYYRRFGLCRNELRRLGSLGHIPGLVKSSW